jgi:hypothetical protein
MSKEIEELDRIWNHYLKTGHSPYSDTILFGNLALKNLDWVSENAHNNLETIIDAMYDIRDPIYAANYIAIMIIYTRDMIPDHEDCKYIMTNYKILPYLMENLLGNKSLPIDLLKSEYFDSIDTFPLFGSEACADIRDLREKVVEERIYEIGIYLHGQSTVEGVSMETIPKEWLVKVYGY